MSAILSRGRWANLQNGFFSNTLSFNGISCPVSSETCVLCCLTTGDDALQHELINNILRLIAISRPSPDEGCEQHPWYQCSSTWFPVISSHDDVTKWKHFPRYWPFVWGIHRSPVNSPHKGQRRGALMFSLICAWINDWVNNREGGDLRRHRAHHDVIVMSTVQFTYNTISE